MSEQKAATYKLSHLATFSVTAQQARVKASDALDRLKDMEASTGVWTMNVLLQIDRRAIVVIDADTHKVHIRISYTLSSK